MEISMHMKQPQDGVEINFFELEDYLAHFGYPRNELMKQSSFYIPQMTAYEYLAANMRAFMNVDAMTYYGRNIKYQEFAERIDEAANALKGVGLTFGKRFASLLPNIPEAAYVLYGASKIGAVPSNIDPRTKGAFLLNYIKKECIVAIVIVDAMYETAIRPIEHELKSTGINGVVIIPATNSLPPVLKGIVHLKSAIKHTQRIQSNILKNIYWDELIINTKFERATAEAFKPNSEAMIQHSSGTSKGTPKSIPLTNENINMFVEKHKPTVFGNLPYGTKMLHVLPYFASYGAINCAHLGFNLGLTLQEIPEFNFCDFGYIAAKQKSEILIGVPNWFNLNYSRHCAFTI